MTSLRKRAKESKFKNVHARLIQVLNSMEREMHERSEVVYIIL